MSGNRKRTCQAVFLALLLFQTPCLATVAGAQEDTSRGEAPFSVRQPDPVIVTNEQLGLAFDGTATEKLRVLAHRGDRFEVVPFQIDERGPLGDLILTQGPLAGKERNEEGDYVAATTAGIFQGQDEIVILARSAGPRAPEDTWPAEARRAVEIRVLDPKAETASWFYLASFDDPPPLSDRDDIAYRTQERKKGNPEVHIVSNRYHAGFTDMSKPVAQSDWRIMGQGGTEGPDIMKTFQSIMNIRLGFLSFEFTLKNIVPRRLGQIDGPVRVVRRIRNNIKFAGIPLPAFLVKKLAGTTLDTDSYYYPDFFYFDGKISVPHVVVKYGSKSTAVFTTDFNSNATGMSWLNEKNQGQACVIDGIMSPREKALDPDLYQWSLFYGPQGGWMNILTFGEGFRPLDIQLYYMDNALDGYRPEGDPPIRSFASTGYRVKDFQKIEKDKPLEFTTYIFAIDPDFKVGDEQKYVDIIYHPLEISVERTLGTVRVRVTEIL